MRDTEAQAKTNKSWTRRKAARPGEILDAALKIFAEKGFAGARMEDIAARAGVTKGTIYLYFPGKEDVFKTLVREMIGKALADAKKTLGSFPGGPRDRLLLLLRAVAAFMQSDSRLVALPKIIIAESGNFPELARFWREEVIDKVVVLIEQALLEGADKGQFRPLPVAYTAKLCVAPIMLGVIWRATFAHFDPREFDFDAYLSTHIDVLMHGLVPEGAEP